jgi:hypothetical protein
MCHVSCSHLLRPTCTPRGNYILAYVKMKYKALCSNAIMNIKDCNTMKTIINTQSRPQYLLKTINVANGEIVDWKDVEFGQCPSSTYTVPTPAGGRASRRLPPAGIHFAGDFQQRQQLVAAAGSFAVGLVTSTKKKFVLLAPNYREVANFNRVRLQTYRLILVTLSTKLPWSRYLQPG